MNKFAWMFIGLMATCSVRESSAAVARRRPRARDMTAGTSVNQTRNLGLASRLVEDMQLLGLNDPVLSEVAPEGNNLELGNALNPLPDYEDSLFDDYSDSTSASDRFLSSEICGRKYFCRKGDRGPCKPNEVFVSQKNASSAHRPSCTGLVSSPWNGCYPSGKVDSSVAGSIVSGSCALRFPSRPCFGYPPGYRYSKQTKRCYPCSSQSKWGGGMVLSGPCSPNKIFVDIDGVSGMCRCRDPNHLLHRNDDNCYHMYAKGPCPEGQWLEPYTNGYGVCRKSPCPNSKCDGRHIYWRPTPASRGGCYKSFTRGPCKYGSYFLVEDYATKKGRCVSRYGSSYNPVASYNSYGFSPNRFGSPSNSRLNSIWSNFGMYPTFGMQDFVSDDFSEDFMGLDYDMF